jgi:hypothetical protein
VSLILTPVIVNGSNDLLHDIFTVPLWNSNLLSRQFLSDLANPNHAGLNDPGVDATQMKLSPYSGIYKLHCIQPKT